MTNYHKCCPICTGETIKVLAPYRSKHIIFKNMNLICCLSCSFIFASPAPSAKALNQYNGDYFNQAHGGKQRSNASLAFFSGIAKIRLNYLCLILRKLDLSPESLLEIGPGQGFFARAWLNKFPLTSYQAIESDSTCHEQLKEIGVQIVDEKGPQTAIELVVISHVLEHHSCPDKFLLNATSSLISGGVLFMEVPCLDYIYKAIDEPHLLFFDKGSMKSLLDKIGFQAINISYHGVSITEAVLFKKLREIWFRLHKRMISYSFYTSLMANRDGMDGLSDIERAMMTPYKAHYESSKPANWLRVVAIKK